MEATDINLLSDDTDVDLQCQDNSFRPFKLMRGI